MASDRTVETFKLFLSKMEKFYFLPFKIRKEVYFNMEVQVTKTFLLTSCYCFIGLIILLTHNVKGFSDHMVDGTPAQDYIIIPFVCSVNFAALGCFIWTIVYMRETTSLLNALLKFNRDVCEL